MTSKLPAKPQDDREERAQARLQTVVERHVVGALGSLEDLYRVQVTSLWEGHYRVNVFTGADATSARILHSFFVRTDGDGAVVACTPAIRRRS
jgi:hypothetical protein